MVGDIIGDDEFESDVDEVRVLRAPQVGLAVERVAQGRQVDGAADQVVGRSCAEPPEDLLTRAQGQPQLGVLPWRPAELHLEVDATMHGIVGPGRVDDVGGRNLLQPDAAPDAGAALVPDAVRFMLPVLLAARVLTLDGVVLGADDELVVGAVIQRVGDVECERGLAAAVRADVLSVDPNVRGMVDGTEVQQESAVRVGRCGGVGVQRCIQLKLPPVPDDLVVAGVADAGGCRFGDERHQDLAVEPVGFFRGMPMLAASNVLVVVGEAPGTVEGGPVLADEEGAWVGAVLCGGAQWCHRESTLARRPVSLPR